MAAAAENPRPTRTALVTGVSSGIGRATAALLVDHGFAVVGTCRRPTALSEDERVDGVRYRPLDLADHGSIDGFVEAMHAEGIPVDVLVNNAGESQCGPLEDLPHGALERLFAVNVLGPVALTQALLPGMRERGYGRVVMIGSMLASFPLAYRSSYVASKAAIKGFATAARLEMAPYGVWLTTVEPGSIKTGISTRRTKYIAEDSPHTKAFRSMMRTLDSNEREGADPRRVARTVLEAVEDDEPAPLYAVGSSAPVVFALQRALPRGVLEGFVGRAYGQSKRSRA